MTSGKWRTQVNYEHRFSQFLSSTYCSNICFSFQTWGKFVWLKTASMSIVSLWHHVKQWLHLQELILSHSFYRIDTPNPPATEMLASVCLQLYLTGERKGLHSSPKPAPTNCLKENLCPESLPQFRSTPVLIQFQNYLRLDEPSNVAHLVPLPCSALLLEKFP